MYYLRQKKNKIKICLMFEKFNFCLVLTTTTCCSWCLVPQTWTFFDVFQEALVKGLIDCLGLRHKLFLDDSLAIKEANQNEFDLWLAHSYFLGFREAEMSHYMPWHLVSGLYSNTEDLSPVMKGSKKWG